MLELLRQNLNCLKVFVEFNFAPRPFYNSVPLKEKHIWPHTVNDLLSPRDGGLFKVGPTGEGLHRQGTY